MSLLGATEGESKECIGCNSGWSKGCVNWPRTLFIPGVKACPVITGPTTKVFINLFEYCNRRDDDDDDDDDDDGDDDDDDDDDGDAAATAADDNTDDDDFNCLWGTFISLIISLVKR